MRFVVKAFSCFQNLKHEEALKWIQCNLKIALRVSHHKAPSRNVIFGAELLMTVTPACVTIKSAIKMQTRDLIIFFLIAHQKEIMKFFARHSLKRAHHISSDFLTVSKKKRGTAKDFFELSRLRDK